MHYSGVQDKEYLLSATHKSWKLMMHALEVYISLCQGDFAQLLVPHEVTLRKPYGREVLAILSDLSVFLKVPPVTQPADAIASYTAMLALLEEAKCTKGVCCYRPQEYTHIIRTKGATAQALGNACHTLARACSGQFEIALDSLVISSANMVAFREIAGACRALAGALGLSPGESMGRPQAHWYKDACFDIYQVIRYRLAWDASPNGGMAVDFRAPVRYSNVVRPPMFESVLTC